MFAHDPQQNIEIITSTSAAKYVCGVYMVLCHSKFVELLWDEVR